MSNEDNKMVLTMARLAPSWYKWGGYGLVMGLGISYALAPGAWILYVLCAFNFGLVYWGFECYNQFANYYNAQQIKHLPIPKGMEEFFEQLNGTFQDESGLIKEKESEEDSSTDGE